MAYIISSTYIPSDLKEVPIDDHFIQQLTTLSGLSLSGPTATLLSDATLLPNYQQQHLLPTIAIELKPKWGSYSQCPTIHPNHKSIKATTTRYQLLQRYKRAVLKTIAEESNYDPVDLFSLQKDRMRHALVSLFQIPHNNLTLFRNGDRIERNTTTTTTNNNNQWEDEMNAFVDGVFPDWKGLLDTIIQILLQEKVLKNILKAQNICGMDIEGVYRVYDAFIRKGGGGDSRPSIGHVATDDGEDDQHIAAQKQQIESLSEQEACKILQNYLISSTARDCGVIIALQKIQRDGDNEEEIESDTGVPQTEMAVGRIKVRDCDVRYRVTVIDLDRKALEKIPKHYELDQALMKFARQVSK